ncbi:MAG: YHS domain-containing protein [Planctomycetes bacterium]|nr:YHS domain-containing protein [Planctomycetota bacterium]
MKHLLAAAIALAASLPAAAQAAADEDMTVDPVCGMNIHKSTAEYSETFQGEQFWFCNLNCHRSFKETPDKYAAAVQKVRKASYLVRQFTRPAKIYSNTDTQFNFLVERNPAFKENVTWKPKSMSAEVTVQAEGGKSVSSKMTFRALKEDGWFRADARYLLPGRVEIRARITFDDGEYDEAVFRLPIVPGAEFETGKENDGKRMDMIIQHETMRKLGKYWVLTGEELLKGKEGAEGAKKNLQFVKGYQKYIDQMVPHVFEDELDEFKSLNAEFGKALGALEGTLNGDDPGKSLEEWKRVEALHCTECHMKFRWSVFSDLKNYPVVEPDKK